MKIITNNILEKVYRFLGRCENFVFLDTSKPDDMNCQSLLFTDPVERMQFYEGQDEAAFLEAIQQKQYQGFYVAGWFSYEFGYLLEPSLKKRLCREADKGALLADLAVFRQHWTFDHLTGETDFTFDDDDENPSGITDCCVSNLRTTQKEQEYIEALSRVLGYIEAGDTYQVNYTLKLLFDFNGSFESFYSNLRRNQSVSYGAYIRFGDSRIMSFSPELFFWKSESKVMVRPMKGTVKRGRTVEEDSEHCHFLKTDVKNQSENVMIVDLLRNDLGRLMHHLADGDVQVDSLFDVETYETLLQMTSTISGRTSREALEKVSLHSFFKAIYPCGSVTGAPKIRTMEIIDELEKDRRGVYTGAIGYMTPDGGAVFNVPIRTVAFDGLSGEMGIGSGIVHDSDPVQEWQECLLKGKFLTSPRRVFQLFETMLWQPEKGVLFLEDHLQRLNESAGYFLFGCDIRQIRKQIHLFCKTLPNKPQRVRLILEKDGSCRLEVSGAETPKYLKLPVSPTRHEGVQPKIAISNLRMQNHKCWLFHKTTNRDSYTQEYGKASAAGFFDVVFCNDRGLVTEGSISNVVIYKDGIYLTPPVKDGLLPGVMRKQLLLQDDVTVVEKSFTKEDLQQAAAIFLCNSVRGVVQVTL